MRCRTERADADVRLLLVSANFRPAVGGIDRFTEVLATGLAGAGHDVTVLCCRKDGAPLHEAADGVRIERIRSSYALHRLLYLPYPLPAPWSLVAAIRRLLPRADVVHVQDALYGSSVAVLAAAKRRRTPSVLTQHVAFVPQHNVVLDAAQHVAIATLGRCARLASAVTTVNPAVADWVTSTWNVPAAAFPVGVPVASPVPDRGAVRDRLGLPRDRFLALFVGRNVPKKGLDHFLDAHDDDYELVAVTDRPATDDPRARFVPFMPHESLQQLLGAVDAFVLPSVGEGFPVVIQEALAHGLPVVTTEGDGYDRYVTPEDVVFVEPSGDAIRAALRRLVHEPAHREALTSRARRVASSELGLDGFVGAYEELYERLVREDGRR